MINRSVLYIQVVESGMSG